MTRFYDIHFHAMNLSHPNILAFLARFNLRLLLLAGSVIGPIVTFLAGGRIKRTLNLLSVMENDIANFFLLLEYSLKYWPSAAGDPPPADGGKIIAGNMAYDRLVLTPLMMDFGAKNITTASYYRFPPQKPIAEQVIDLFNGIARYTKYELRASSTGEVRVLERLFPPLFEIYPFLGLNPRNYTLSEIETLLKKYFDDYTPDWEKFRAHMGTFDGDIGRMGSFNFMGIKVYPPLGFDPWPEKEPEELEKVNYLYNLASEKGLPITSHSSDGGFVTVKDSAYRTDPARWEEVLKRYPELKLNLAHMGHEGKRRWGIFPRKAWRKKVLNLVDKYENVYTDFSCLAFDDSFYEDLRKTLDQAPKKLRQRILFGSDFMINLLWIDSYNDYLARFLKTRYLTTEERHLFCSVNPCRFLKIGTDPIFLQK
ncbi:MAG TPA: amidohydrolase family protein [Syntrophales bacterium]|nr:amidohydrolase family protein [Syntrophales bacterium]HOL60158.1 amidohydrolase family protein [Syntrophales bacterium]HPO36273.1 amidohydrolase family protein [Syntrophales bacterium]